MSSNLAMTIVGGVEWFLTTLVAVLFWQKGFQRQFRAMGIYLAVRAISAPPIFALLWATQHYRTLSWHLAYFFAYWPLYLLCSLLLYFVCAEVFKTAMAPFKGLQKLGLITFRWVAIASAVVSFSTFSFIHTQWKALPDIAFRLMRSVSVLELCMLGFLCVCIHSLKLSLKGMTFGIALGLGISATNDFLMTATTSRYIQLTANWEFVFEAVTLLVLCIWIGYLLVPQPEQKPVVVPVNSAIYRWNEIASALGYTGTRVVVPQPSSGFFLTDVEKVVERVLARNLKGEERKSET
jgi:hypothetical protein